jgi:hypothetical protein
MPKLNLQTTTGCGPGQRNLFEAAICGVSHDRPVYVRLALSLNIFTYHSVPVVPEMRMSAGQNENAPSFTACPLFYGHAIATSEAGARAETVHGIGPPCALIGRGVVEMRKGEIRDGERNANGVCLLRPMS